jgi:hypothetical protein
MENDGQQSKQQRRHVGDELQPAGTECGQHHDGAFVLG